MPGDRRQERGLRRNPATIGSFEKRLAPKLSGPSRVSPLEGRGLRPNYRVASWPAPYGLRFPAGPAFIFCPHKHFAGTDRSPGRCVRGEAGGFDPVYRTASRPAPALR
jgi:hypothetical protein